MTQGEGTETLLFNSHLEKVSRHTLACGVRPDMGLDPSSAVLTLCVASDKIFNLSRSISCPKPDSLHGERNQLFETFLTYLNHPQPSPWGEKRHDKSLLSRDIF